jgi:hypothetical protein
MGYHYDVVNINEYGREKWLLTIFALWRFPVLISFVGLSGGGD